MISNIILNKAIDEINRRRNMAHTVNNMHFEEIHSKIPEIAEINSQLAKTGMSILKIIRSGENVDERINELKESNTQAQTLVKNLLVQNGYPEDYLKIKYTCEKCFDTGFVNHDRCDCLKKVISRITTNEMNKHSQINLCSFESFNINYYQGSDADTTEKYRDIMGRIFSYCKKYADNFSISSRSLLMFGKTGLGKTHLSLAIASEVLAKGYSVLYDSAQNYLNRIEKEHFGRDSSGSDTLSALIDADLLILDDFGTEYDKPFYVATIYNIINTRLNKGLPTIISTNLYHEEMLEKYGERIFSRLFTIYESLEFVGSDVRLIKRKLGK